MEAAIQPVRWGILGPGSIANRFCADAKPLENEGVVLAAVGSRDQAKADAFGDKFGIPRRHASYQTLVSDPDVDVIYVATPHPFHQEHALLALRAGKAVLCEKPFTINAREAEVVIAEARQRGLFLMEGMWSRLFPAVLKAQELVKAGAIGAPQLLQADFGFRNASAPPEHRLLNPALGGGSLMDVGIYPLSLASLFFGPPARMVSLANVGATGVDETVSFLLGYAGGEMAVLASSVRISTPQQAVLVGTEGSLTLPSPWWRADTVCLKSKNQTEDFPFPYPGGGFQYEALHVSECVRAGKTESEAMPLDETLSLMRTLDELRAQMGVRYPMD